MFYTGGDLRDKAVPRTSMHVRRGKGKRKEKGFTLMSYNSGLRVITDRDEGFYEAYEAYEAYEMK